MMLEVLLSVACIFSAGKTKQEVIKNEGTGCCSVVEVKEISEKDCSKLCEELNDFDAKSLKNEKDELALLKNINNKTYLNTFLNLIGQRENDLNNFFNRIKKIISRNCPKDFHCGKRDLSKNSKANEANNEIDNYANSYSKAIKEADQKATQLIDQANKIIELTVACEKAKNDAKMADSYYWTGKRGFDSAEKELSGAKEDLFEKTRDLRECFSQQKDNANCAKEQKSLFASAQNFEEKNKKYEENLKYFKEKESNKIGHEANAKAQCNKLEEYKNQLFEEKKEELYENLR